MNQSASSVNALCDNALALPLSVRRGISRPGGLIFLEFPKSRIRNYGNQCGILRVLIHSGPWIDFGFIHHSVVLSSSRRIDFVFFPIPQESVACKILINVFSRCSTRTSKRWLHKIAECKWVSVLSFHSSAWKSESTTQRIVAGYIRSPKCPTIQNVVGHEFSWRVV